MGLDLTLLPIMNGRIQDDMIAHSQLACNRDSDLFELLMDLPADPIPRGYFGTFLCREGDGDPHYGNTQETPYGQRLTYVSVADLLPFADQVQTDYQNRAVWAYLRELPPTLPIVLYWH